MVTSRMFEGYCVDIEALLREGQLRTALRFGIALPDICAALEAVELTSSCEHYAAWCKEWLHLERPGARKPISGERLCRLYLRSSAVGKVPARQEEATSAALLRLRMRRRARSSRSLGRPRVWQPVNRVQKFEVNLIEALVAGGRRWYLERASSSTRIQQNLARLAISG